MHIITLLCFWDLKFRTHRILSIFQKMGVPGQKIDYL
jgi:hypothetical protein